MLRLTRFLILTVLFCRAGMPSSAQDTEIWSLQYKLPDVAVYTNLAEPTDRINRILEEENTGNGRLKALVYAAGIEVNLTPATSGQWDTIPGKGYVWRLGIRAENAFSLNLFIEHYRLQPGMAFYAYNRDATDATGPFDARNNRNGGILPVRSLSGNTIIAELNIPLHAKANDCLTITSVGYGFRAIPGQERIVPMASAGCNIDVNCIAGNHWQREKRSVVRLETIIRSGGTIRTQYCSGTLINQAVDPDRKKPYILTANHCISTGDMAQGTSAVFAYEKSLCSGTRPAIPNAIAGSVLLATKQELDFTLLELSEDVTENRLPYFAGWNISPGVLTSAVGIHHPQGDVRKISVTGQSLTRSTFSDPPSDFYCDENAHWLVRRWDQGITEGGSSGSPLFSSDHFLVGTLSGGNAGCNNPVNDYYAVFGEQWNRYPVRGESLKPWLDPENKGVVSLRGYDPVAPFEGRCDTLGHIGHNETKILIDSDKWGYLTSQNNKGWVSFAEKMNSDTVAKIIGLEASVAKASGTGSEVRFCVWQGGEFPVGNPVYTKNVVVTAEYCRYPMHIYFEKTLEITGNFFIGYSVEYKNPVDTFAVYQSAKRPYAGLPAMHIEESDGTWRALEDDISPIYSSLGIRAIGRFGKIQDSPDHIPFDDDLRIVSQPGNDNVFVYFKDPGQKVNIECYDTSGRRMPLNELNRYMVMYDKSIYLQVEMNISSLAYGMYFIKASDTRKTKSGKFIRL